MRYILGIIIIALGVLLMKYSVKVTEFTGQIDFAEKYLAAPLAGTYTWWKIVGITLIILSLAWMFGYFKFLPF